MPLTVNPTQHINMGQMNGATSFSSEKEMENKQKEANFLEKKESDIYIIYSLHTRKKVVLEGVIIED